MYYETASERQKEFNPWRRVVESPINRAVPRKKSVSVVCVKIDLRPVSLSHDHLERKLSRNISLHVRRETCGFPHAQQAKRKYTVWLQRNGNLHTSYTNTYVSAQFCLCIYHYRKLWPQIAFLASKNENISIQTIIYKFTSLAKLNNSFIRADRDVIPDFWRVIFYLDGLLWKKQHMVYRLENM